MGVGTEPETEQQPLAGPRGDDRAENRGGPGDQNDHRSGCSRPPQGSAVFSGDALVDRHADQTRKCEIGGDPDEQERHHRGGETAHLSEQDPEGEITRIGARGSGVDTGFLGGRWKGVDLGQQSPARWYGTYTAAASTGDRHRPGDPGARIPPRSWFRSDLRPEFRVRRFTASVVVLR